MTRSSRPTTAGDRLTLASLALGLNVALTSGLGLVAWVVAARLLPTSELAGDLALVTAMVAIASVAELGGTVTLPRFLPVLGRHNKRAIDLTYAGTALTAAVLAAVFVMVAPRLTESYALLAGNVPLQVFFVIGTYASTIFTLQDAVLIALRAARWVTIQNGLFAAGKLLLFVALVLLEVPNPFYVSWVVALLVAVPLVNTALVPRFLPRVDRPSSVRRADVSRFGLHASAAVVVAHASTTFLPVIVFAVAGPIDGAYFAVAFTFAVALENLALGLGIALTVEGAYDREQLRQLVRRALTFGMPVMIMICFVTIVAAPLLLLAFGREYAEGATTALRLLAAGAIPQALVHLYVAVARVRNHAARVMALQLVLTTMVFVLIVLLVPDLGLAGVGVAWVGVHLLLALLVLPSLLRSLRTPDRAGESR